MSNDEPKKVGLLIGREWSWPNAFINEVNHRNEGVVAEFVKIGGTFLDGDFQYDVIIDRMSHEIPYYRTYLKFAALNGCYIINNPFMTSADDKFFGIDLVNKMGGRTPRTVVLPNKRVENENVPESFRNLSYPMDWQGIIDYVGVPAILKDNNTGGRRFAKRVNNIDELIRSYDESDTLTVVLQQIIETDIHIHCFVIGREEVLATRYSPEEKKYLADSSQLNSAMKERLTRSARKITQAYNYDMNMVEYVIHKGDPYLINPTNPVPDLDIKLLTPGHFNWIIKEMATFAIKMALEPVAQYDHYHWKKALDKYK
jgi:glutathione synthase/RimK-type ligase-like ATP-grasp enzyme